MSNNIELSSGNGTDPYIQLNILEEEPDKQGIPAYLNENSNLPGHRVRLFKKEFGENVWFEISGPIRKMNDGEYVINSRTNDQGEFLDEKGQSVDESNAAKQFEYIKDSDENVVYGTLGTLNIKNTKVDGSPTKITMVVAKLFGDDNVLKIERKVAASKSKEGDERSALYDEIKTMRKENGIFHNLFINNGKDRLESMGFEIRV